LIAARKSAARDKKGRNRAVAPRPGARYAPPLSVSHRALLVNGSDRSFRHVIYCMILASGRLDACREFFGRTMGLSGSQFQVLYGTAHRQADRGITIRELAHFVRVAPTHVTTEVGRLMRKGLLQKKPNRDDRRSVLVSLTPKGQRLVSEVGPHLRGINDVLFQDVDRKEFVAVGNFLERFARNTEEALAVIDGHLRKARHEQARWAGSATYKDREQTS
jgi:DNA-binding MarR family transcriptional regulator